MKNYEDMTYLELCEAMQTAPYGKECRKIHKVLKKNFGDGLFFYQRYPMFPFALMAIAIVVSIIAICLYL
ncbi:MAG: hypothetical protein E7290_09420 [Lachnospiraceae bacterium]|nr:hypothetical protein [Lachnospiraceae bacterium]